MAEAQTQESEEELSKGGRPLKFQSASELRQKLEAYFSDCDPHVAERLIMKTRSDGSTYTATEEYITLKKPYTINGLCLALKTTRDVILDYESGKYDEKATDFDATKETADRFSNVLKEAKMRLIAETESRILSGDTPAAAGIFWMTNVDKKNWKARQEIDHTTGGQPMRALVEIVRRGDRADSND